MITLLYNITSLENNTFHLGYYSALTPGITSTMVTMLYRSVCRAADRLVYPVLPAFAKSAWNHSAGPKTVFFWAPTIKWCLVGAGLADLARPVEKLSISQNIALLATGAIWTRYSFVIVPINYYLASVNFFVGCIGLTQLLRIAAFNRLHPEGITDCRSG
uniref:Mitochondrial pyruvate carrier n=2 Tax=Parascaris TaxID=6254 RepID=A0A915AAS5_PARUN